MSDEKPVTNLPAEPGRGEVQQDDPPDILTWLERLYPQDVASTHGRRARVPSAAEYEALVEEVALGYFKEDELAKRFQTTLEVITQIIEHEQFQADMLKKRRELDETDLPMRTLARRKIRDSIDDMRAVIESAESQQARIKAFDQLRQTAGMGDRREGGGGEGVSLQINTNLDVKKGDEGHYVIEATPVKEDSGGDFTDLLE